MSRDHRVVVAIGLSAASAAAALANAGCTTELPTHVAEIELVGTLDSNTCGIGGFDADETFDETADLYGYAGDDAVFQWTDSDSTIDGTSTAKGVYTFTTTSSSVAITDTAGNATCTVERRTRLTLTITPPPTAPTDGGVDADAGTDDQDVAYVITGTLTEDLYATSGSNCLALRSDEGGSYDTFPCRAVYDLEGGSL